MTRLLGIDFGTGGVRLGVFDIDRAVMLGETEATYATRYPRPDWAEQSPHDWWEALGRASRALMAELRYPEIAGIAVATTASTVVVCREDGTPLRPALLWMDCRAGAEAERTAQSRHPVFGGSEGGDASEWLIPKAMWLKSHEPAIYDDADVICECLDYINFRLCGAWAASRMNATCKWNYDATAAAFPTDLYRDFGIPEIIGKIPNRVIPVGGAIAPITPAAAEHLGLRARPLLVQGGIDAHIGMIGAGTLDPGEMLMIAGTSVVQLFQIARHRPLAGFWGPYPNALTDGLSLVEGGQVSAGSVLSWMADDIFRQAVARGRGLSCRRHGSAHARLPDGQPHALSRSASAWCGHRACPRSWPRGTLPLGGRGAGARLLACAATGVVPGCGDPPHRGLGRFFAKSAVAAGDRRCDRAAAASAGLPQSLDPGRGRRGSLRHRPGA
jgi:ribulose kinase